MENLIYKTEQGRLEIMALYEKFLAAWPVPYRVEQVHTRYGETAVICCGDKAQPPLVLLHGASSNATAWAGEVKNYSRHFYVLAVDVIGEPGKSAQTRLPWEGEAYAEWLADVFDGLGLNEACLLGLSQGGWLALRFATTYPGRVKKLALLSPAGVCPTRTDFIVRAMIYTLPGAWGVRRLNRYVFGDKPMQPEVEEFMDLIMRHVRARFDREYIFSDAELGRLNMPVLLLGGKKDVIRSLEAINSRLAVFVPGLQNILLPDAGHVLIDTAEQVLPFLSV